MRVKAFGVRLYQVTVERIRTPSSTDVSGQHFRCPMLVSFLSGKSCPDSVCLDSVQILRKKMLSGVSLSGRTRTRQSCPCPLSLSLSADVRFSDVILGGNLNWMVQFTKVKTWWVSNFFLKLPLEILIFSNYQYQYIIILYLNGLIELRTYSITIFRFQPGQLSVSTIRLSCFTSLCFR